MIYLNLMRHAKTDLNNCNINDFERPICKKGILNEIITYYFILFFKFL